MRSAHVDQPSNREGTIAGRYRIERMLGVGGTARVLRVIDEASGSALALKLLDASAPPRTAALFELEYQTLASLRHPRIVRAFDYGLDRGRGFYTMELLEGDDLKAHAPVSWREACRYVRDAAQALGVLHARRLVHRDVSPRNLWRTPDGRVKLIDFGALSPFGATEHLVGTPPNLAPEALRTGALDQRADLYALGAVAYYLLSGRQAFPARDVRDLPALWAQGFVPVTQCVAELGRADLPPPPPELERLITALLSLEPLARPSSAEELIERLDAFAGDALQGAKDERPEARLANSAFVGRERELRRLRRLLGLAHKGHGQVLLVEGEAGSGRSRLLRELALEAQVAPATVLAVDAAGCTGLYGVATALALQLLTALPEPARAAAATRASVIAHVSPRLRERLGEKAESPPSELAGGALELRVRAQAALRDWFLEVAREHPLAVLVDGLERVDDGSAAFLLALADGLARARLLLACSLRSEHGRKAATGERAFAQRARRMTLGPLGEPEVRALLRSVLGDVEHLARLANRLEQAARGNPGYILELTGQLVRRGFLRLSSGGWVLPRELPAESLASSHEHALIAALELLGPGASELAEVLGMPTDVIALDLAKKLAESVSPRLFLHLDELLQHDVLVREGESLRFVHPQVRAIFRARLRPARRRKVARILGEHLLAQGDADSLTRLAAGLHLVEGGDPRGRGIVAATSVKLALHEHDRLRLALPLIESALELLRLEGHDERALVGLTVPLAMSGYYANLRYAERYGDAGLAALGELLGLPRARALRHVLGRKLGVMVALAIAAVRLRRKRDAGLPTFRDALLLLFHCVAALTASATLVLDARSAARRAEVLAPLAGLGKDSAPAFVYEFCSAVAASARDTTGASYARLARVLARLDDAAPIRGLPEPLRKRYRAGVLYVMGLMEGMRDGDAALRTAERLDQMGLYHEMSADQVRMMYFGNQGARAAFEQARRRVEQHAIQHGTAAIVETWTLSMQLGLALRTHDVMSMKRTSQELARLSRSLPMLEPSAQRSRGMYLMLHGKHVEALPALEGCLDEPVRGRTGWGRVLGTLAHTYNALGDHTRALAICEQVIAAMDEDDHAFTALSIPALTEHAVARAGLGEHDAARAEVAGLIARHGPRRGPLTLGQIHEAGLTVALLARDGVEARRQLGEVEHWYLSTGVPPLMQHCKALRQRVEASDPTLARGRDAALGASEAATEVARALAGCETLDACAERALRLLAEPARATAAYLYFLDAEPGPRLAASLGGAAPAMLAPWVRRALERELDEGATAGLSVHVETADLEPEVRVHGHTHYRLVMLTALGAHAGGVVGACILGAADAAPRCALPLLAALAHRLAGVRASQSAQATVSA
ncbi:MAG: AAA family ATPase [Polyangiales bacterium]